MANRYSLYRKKLLQLL